MEREILFGRQAVLETLRAGRRSIHRVWVSETARPSPAIKSIVAEAGKAGVDLRRGQRRDLQKVTKSEHHQGVAAEVSGYPYVELDDLTGGHGPIGRGVMLFLDRIQDPQNLGSILRSAECAGVLGAVIPASESVSVTPAVVRASAGATEHTRLAMVPDLASALDAAKKSGMRIIGLEAGENSTDYRDVTVTAAVGLVVGSEGSGLRKLVRRRCDELASIPVHGRIESLNAGVAGGIALYEICRRQSGQGDQARKDG